MKIFYENDVDRQRLAKKNVVVVGFGSQGHAHALNLRYSGFKGMRNPNPDRLRKRINQTDLNCLDTWFGPSLLGDGTEKPPDD